MNNAPPGTFVPIPECPVCGATVRRPVFGRGRDAFDLARCEQCGVIHALGHHPVRLLNEGYGARAQTSRLVRDRKRHNVALFQRLSEDRLTPPFSGARALDLGCNTGALLDELRTLGWRTEGVERSDGAARLAATHHVIYDVDIEDEHSRIDSLYQLITMTHVLEHLRKPVTAIRFIGRHLAPSGVAIIEVPNWDDPARPLWGRKYRPLELGDHICFFDRRTLASTLELGGLRVETMWSGAQAATSLMPSLLTAVDTLKGLLPRRPKTMGAVAARPPTAARRLPTVQAAVLRALDRLDPWLAKLQGDESRWGANLVAVVTR